MVTFKFRPVSNVARGVVEVVKGFIAKLGRLA